MKNSEHFAFGVCTGIILTGFLLVLFTGRLIPTKEVPVVEPEVCEDVSVSCEGSFDEGYDSGLKVSEGNIKAMSAPIIQQCETPEPITIYPDMSKYITNDICDLVTQESIDIELARERMSNVLTIEEFQREIDSLQDPADVICPELDTNSGIKGRRMRY